MGGQTEVCSCPSAESCEACKEDTIARAQSKDVVKPHFTCEAHGAFKEYQEHLLNYKNWCIILCTFLSIPLCLFCWAVDLNLAWRLTSEMEEEEWDKTSDIDNPLSPWVTKYKGELNLDDGENFHDRPPLEIVIRKFRTAKVTAYTAAVLFTVFFMG